MSSVVVDADRLAQFAVRIRTGSGTASGCFIAPGWVLTCAHVVARIRDGGRVEIVAHRSVSTVPLSGVVAVRSAYASGGTKEWPWPDLALLRVIDAAGEAFTANPVPRLDLEGKPPHSGEELRACGFTPRATGQKAVRREPTFTWEGPDEDDYWWFKTGQATPGLSGSMLVCPRRLAIVALITDSRDIGSDAGALAIPVAALTQLEHWPPDFHEALTAVVDAHRQAASQDVVEWRRVFKAADHLLDASLEPWEPFEGAESSPSAVLRPEADVVPYLFRDDDLVGARDWCERGAPFAAALLPADGGAGKTRFAVKLARLMAGRGWLAGRVADHGAAELSHDAIARIAAVQLPRLVVVDYAEAVPNLRELVDLVARTATGAAPVRLLALSRTRAGSRTDPLAQLTKQGTTRWEHALLARQDPTAAIADLTEQQRKELFSEAYCAFTATDDSGELVSVPLLDLAPPRYRLPLEVLFEAFDQARTRQLGRAPDATEPPVSRVLDHERAYWRKTSGGTIEQEHLDRAIVAATMAGAASREEARAAILAANPALDTPEDSEALATVQAWAERSYSGGQVLNPLRPDRLGEALCAEVICETEAAGDPSEGLELRDPGLLPRLLSLPDDDQVANVLDLLARLTAYDPQVAVLTAVALLETHTDLVPRAERQTEGRVEQPGHYALAQQLHRLLRPQITGHLSSITTELMAQHSQATSLRRDLSVSYNRLGDLAQEAGDAETAGRYFRDSLVIVEALVEAV
ncbi:trypsin-like peptidase domain-containing protein, partial [Glycomyces dulcitolivorans]|uniref:trypsin-like peptidase domain-containing protein n=1 Tax=Glycomyces dulcitolivorans TaxID=2200759 RepID=UPI0013006658